MIESCTHHVVASSQLHTVTWNRKTLQDFTLGGEKIIRTWVCTSFPHDKVWVCVKMLFKTNRYLLSMFTFNTVSIPLGSPVVQFYQEPVTALLRTLALTLLLFLNSERPPVTFYLRSAPLVNMLLDTLHIRHVRYRFVPACESVVGDCWVAVATSKSQLVAGFLRWFCSNAQ